MTYGSQGKHSASGYEPTFKKNDFQLANDRIKAIHQLERHDAHLINSFSKSKIDAGFILSATEYAWGP